jgi:DNA-binding PadR family transcriptional regulator
VVLSLICEKPAYGLALAELLAPVGSIGRIWQVPKAVVYRGLHQLEIARLVEAAAPERSRRGPVRTLYTATPAGQDAARAWLNRPAAHVRDVRSELLLKLALLERAGRDPRELLRAQRAQLTPIAAGLDERLRAAAGIERTVTLWRYEALAAAMRFLETVSQEAAGQG